MMMMMMKVLSQNWYQVRSFAQGDVASHREDVLEKNEAKGRTNPNHERRLDLRPRKIARVCGCALFQNK